MLLHQGIGLDVFNTLPERKAVHALYECVNNYALARELARGRAYPDHDALYRRLDALLFAMSEDEIDQILDTCARRRSVTPSGSASRSSCTATGTAPPMCWPR